MRMTAIYYRSNQLVLYNSISGKITIYIVCILPPTVYKLFVHFILQKDYTNPGVFKERKRCSTHSVYVQSPWSTSCRVACSSMHAQSHPDAELVPRPVITLLGEL